MECHQSHHKFSENYMILRPEDVSFFNIFCILFNNGMEKRAFVDYPTGREGNIPPKWRIFFSLFAQKLLQSVAMPMSKLGSKFEMWLNLVSCNRNIFVLLANALRGKVVMPVKESETFLSTIGYIDQRVHLDKNIKPDNCRYYSALAAMAAKISYENQAFVEKVVRNHWKMEIIGRGQYNFWNDAWCTDFDISWYELDKYMVKIHGGFMKALGLLRNEGWPRPQECEQDDPPLAYYTIRKKLLQILKQNDRTKYILAGHSLGGALAILFVAVLAMHEETELLERLEGVYTFGQPRVGDEHFKKFMESTLKTYNIKYLRFVYCNDVVPRMPTDDSRFLFKHFGTCIYYNSIYKGQILVEEPHKNYLSSFAPIPRFLNAVWELLRSFILPYVKGPDYSEGWLLKIIRWYGLVLPGISAHNPQDYVNLTRLGSDSLYLQLQQQHLFNKS
ncbi:triacylglycerol lipase OBL1 isoform X2 [Hevea brasiliensis]|uniref:triacylglycerol lipase OBL1 isoform X2 n=1 Tax=Hevea brasiliensis TaxID=3981 RepID=UPI0025E7D344|nr:triacylglycerol lipase OBL1 isoform X2 [Hevea brasiliensis]